MKNNKLVIENMGLCNQVIKKLNIQKRNYDDAYGVAQLALVKAGDSFNPDKGKFPTWAWTQIEGELMHWMHRERRYREVLSGYTVQTEPVQDETVNYEHKKDEQAILGAIQGLNPTLRDMATMLLVKGYTVRECSIALGVDNVTAWRYRNKIRTALGPCLEKLSASLPDESAHSSPE